MTRTTKLVAGSSSVVVPTLTYCLFRSLFDHDPVPVTESWSDFVARFSEHAVYADKLSAPGFGPYVLEAPPTPCRRHGDPPRDRPHRCDRCVTAVTAAVFDVDVGGTDAVVACDVALGGARVARLWYSTWSYSPDAAVPALRLVLPLAAPIHPAAWPAARVTLIRRYSIPADVTKCGGRSHFYFAPAVARPDAPRVFDVGDGAALETAEFTGEYVAAAGDLEDYWPADADDPTGPVDLEPWRTAVAKKATNYRPYYPAKTELLRKVLAGDELAPAGSRNDTTLVACGVLAHAIPEAPMVVLKMLMRPSVDAMLAAGSHLTWTKVDRMLRTASGRARAKVARDKALVANLGRWSSDARVAASGPRPPRRHRS